jgi:cytochrome c peroxidase
MIRVRLAVAAILAAAATIAAGSDLIPDGPAIPADYFDSFLPLPRRFDTAANPATEAKVALGRVLFFDPRLSRNGRLSCHDCHDLARFGADGRMVSLGHVGQPGRRNSPTVYNSAGFVAQFWDGRSPDVEDQSKQPVLNPDEMAMPDAARVVERLRAIPGYAERFEEAFPGPRPALTYDHMALAIGAFERGLVTPGRFDLFLRGEPGALSAIERHGFRRYVEVGCAACHNGPALGGQTFEAIGHVRPYPDARDLGRFEVTGRAEDRQSFRVPGLRNVAETAPYYHDGRVATLEEALASMGTHQLGVTLAAADERAILAFLRSLTGSPPADYVARPELPSPGVVPVEEEVPR